MKRDVLLDTGPLIAFLNRRDDYGDWVAQQWRQITPPLLTCEAVISEACFLLGEPKGRGDAVMQLLERAVIHIPFHLEEHIQPVKKLLVKYQSLPMSLADACLVRMSELHSSSQVLTLDSDFNVYHKHGRQIIPTIMPGRDS